MRGGAAQARLNFPLAASAVQQGFGLAQQQLLQATQEFQESLSQQAFSNRLGFADILSGIGSRLVGNPSITLSSALDPLVRSRLANTTSSSSGFGLQDVGNLALGIGSTALALPR